MQGEVSLKVNRSSHIQDVLMLPLHNPILLWRMATTCVVNYAMGFEKCLEVGGEELSTII